MKRMIGIFMSLLVLIFGGVGTANALIVGGNYGAEVTGSLDCTIASCYVSDFTSGGAGITNSGVSNGPSPSGSSEASTANLNTGILQAQATANGITGSSAFAGALFWDTLTFKNQSGTNVSVGGGNITLTLPASNSLTFGATGGACLMRDFFLGSPICTPYGSTYNPPNLTNSSTFPNTISLSLAGLQTNITYEFSAAIYGQVSPYNNGTANLGDPPNVTISNIPNGISILSADPSAFGLGGPASVPEPAGLALFGIGLLGLMAGLRHRRFG